MDDAEVYDRISLGSTSSVNKIDHRTIQIGSKIVRVPARMMLSLLLEQLQIPETIYCLRQYSHGTFSVTVLFYTSEQTNGINPPQMTITGVRSTSQEVAGDSADVEAIKYLRTLQTLS